MTCVGSVYVNPSLPVWGSLSYPKQKFPISRLGEQIPVWKILREAVVLVTSCIGCSSHCGWITDIPKTQWLKAILCYLWGFQWVRKPVADWCLGLGLLTSWGHGHLKAWLGLEDACPRGLARMLESWCWSWSHHEDWPQSCLSTLTAWLLQSEPPRGQSGGVQSLWRPSLRHHPLALLLYSAGPQRAILCLRWRETKWTPGGKYRWSRSCMTGSMQTSRLSPRVQGCALLPLSDVSLWLGAPGALREGWLRFLLPSLRVLLESPVSQSCSSSDGRCVCFPSLSSVSYWKEGERNVCGQLVTFNLKPETVFLILFPEWDIILFHGLIFWLSLWINYLP